MKSADRPILTVIPIVRWPAAIAADDRLALVLGYHGDRCGGSSVGLHSGTIHIDRPIIAVQKDPCVARLHDAWSLKPGLSARRSQATSGSRAGRGNVKCTQRETKRLGDSKQRTGLAACIGSALERL